MSICIEFNYQLGLWMIMMMDVREGNLASGSGCAGGAPAGEVVVASPFVDHRTPSNLARKLGLRQKLDYASDIWEKAFSCERFHSGVTCH